MLNRDIQHHDAAGKRRYAVLGLPADASLDEVRAAYQQLSGRYRALLLRDPQAAVPLAELNRTYESILFYAGAACEQEATEPASRGRRARSHPLRRLRIAL